MSSGAEPPSKRLQILVTGAAGAVGHCVTSALSTRGHHVVGYDKRPVRLAGEHVVGDLADVNALCEAAVGCDVVVHLAGAPERHDFTRELVPNNVVGTHNVLEAARLANVSRVVYASSIRVVGGLDWEEGTIGLQDGIVPADHYGASKASGEILCEMYARRFGISVVSVRLGWFVRNGEEAAQLPTLTVGPRIYLSHRDTRDFFQLAVAQEPAGYSTVFLTSKNGGDSAFDLEPARRHCGFIPQDAFPEGSEWSDEFDFSSPLVAPSLLPGER